MNPGDKFETSAVHGVGGLGKTALAVQYAYAFADSYPRGPGLVGYAGRTSLVSARSLDLALEITRHEDDRDPVVESYRPGARFPDDAERAAAADIVPLLRGFALAVESGCRLPRREPAPHHLRRVSRTASR